jgi:hypothetical protein
MPGIESPECTDHDERQASVEVGATHVISALRALELAFLLDETTGTGRAEAGRVGRRVVFVPGMPIINGNWFDHFRKLALLTISPQARYFAGGDFATKYFVLATAVQNPGVKE